MLRAVHFHDEPERWREEVSDVVAEDELATEGNAKLRAGELGPEEALGFRGCAAMGLSA